VRLARPALHSEDGVSSQAEPRVSRYDDLVRLCAGAAGKECEIAHYDPAGFDKPDGFKYKFPFRDTPFYVSADKAHQRALGLALLMPRGSCRLDVESRGLPGPCPTTLCVWRSLPDRT